MRVWIFFWPPSSPIDWKKTKGDCLKLFHLISNPQHSLFVCLFLKHPFHFIHPYYQRKMVVVHTLIFFFNDIPLLFICLIVVVVVSNQKKKKKNCLPIFVVKCVNTNFARGFFFWIFLFFFIFVFMKFFHQWSPIYYWYSSIAVDDDVYFVRDVFHFHMRRFCFRKKNRRIFHPTNIIIATTTSFISFHFLTVKKTQEFFLFLLRI